VPEPKDEDSIMSMPTRRKFLLIATTMCVALAVSAGAVLAAELLGTVKSVDADAKKITVTPKDGGDDVVVTVKDETEWYSAKGKKYENFDLAKVKKGALLEITHEDKIASKVVVKKGGAGKKKDTEKKDN
jgi:hypothetical protein